MKQQCCGRGRLNQKRRNLELTGRHVAYDMIIDDGATIELIILTGLHGILEVFFFAQSTAGSSTGAFRLGTEAGGSLLSAMFVCTLVNHARSTNSGRQMI